MASLYESSSKARKIALVVIAIIVGLLFFDTLNLTQENTLDPAGGPRFYMNPDRIFGEIPPAQIPSLEYNAEATFVKESEFLINFPDVAYVYFVEQPRERLTTFEDALKSVAVLGFESQKYTDLGNNSFEWSKDGGTRVMRFNKESNVWELTTAFYQNPAAIANKSIQSDINRYASRANSLISSLGFDTKGFAEGVADVRFVKLGIDGVFLETREYLEADFVFVNVFRNLPLADLKPDGEWPDLKEGQAPPKAITGRVYSEDPRDGQIKLIVSNQMNDFENDIFELDFINYNYLQQSGYLIISPDEAWDRVTRGEGSLTFIQPQNSNYFGEFEDYTVKEFRMDARRTELAYFESSTWSNGYVYPIYIFKGIAFLDDGRIASFQFYIDAIKRAT